MVVCKFFQQGSCRYGQSCRFEHVYGSKYSYYAPQAQASAQVPQTGVTDEQLINQVQSDVQSALHGGQWILSSYAPFKEKPCLPGITDLSPEEARLFIYEAKANNTVEQAVTYMNNLTQDARSKYEQLLQPTPQITMVLRSLYKGESVQSPFASHQNAFGDSSKPAASSVFRSAVQNNSVFNQNITSPGFGQHNMYTSNDPAKSIFAQASSVFNSPPPNMSSNVFGPGPDMAKSIFGQANQNVFNMQTNQSMFSPQVNPASIFAAASQQISAPPDPFHQNQISPFQNTQSSNAFQKSTVPTNVFGNTNVFAQQMDDNGIYSKEEDLTPDQLEAFTSNQFKLGFVPDIPPPKSLCSM